MLIEIKNTNSKHQRAAGFTLVELLVVIAIITVLTAIMVPRLRIINKDRNIREAARLVGSLMSSASQRAANEGSAGVLIERNPNLLDANGVYYGATSLYMMRNVPPFIGDEVGAEATRVSDYVLEIDYPFEQVESGMVLVNDSISVNNGSVRYRILEIREIAGTPLKLELTLRFPDPLPPALPLLNDTRPSLPGVNVPGESPPTYPFVVHRQPRKLESSRVDLPDGHLVDMRYSGPLNPNPNTGVIPDAPRSFFHEVISLGFTDVSPEIARSVQIIFGNQGGIDRVYFYSPKDPAGLTPDGFIDSKILPGSLYLYVTDYEISPAFGHSVLNSPSSLWVVANNISGGVHIGYNVPSPVGSGNLGARIIEARGIARSSTNASQ